VSEKIEHVWKGSMSMALFEGIEHRVDKGAAYGILN